MEDRLEELEQLLLLILKERYTGDITDEEEEKLYRYFMDGYWVMNDKQDIFIILWLLSLLLLSVLRLYH